MSEPPREPVTVRLGEAEQYIARWIATRRARVNREAGVTDARRDRADDIDLVGFGAELAFGKLFNVYPDFSLFPRRGGIDCDRFGACIDVKGTRRKDGRLLAVLKKRELAADWYALMLVDWPDFTFAGFATGDELLQLAQVRDFGHGNTTRWINRSCALTRTSYDRR